MKIFTAKFALISSVVIVVLLGTVSLAQQGFVHKASNESTLTATSDESQEKTEETANKDEVVMDASKDPVTPAGSEKEIEPSPTIVPSPIVDTTIETITYPTCNDTDGGLSYDTRGTLIRCLTGDNCLSQTDKCVSDTTLLEYYCGFNGSMSTLERECKGGCDAGICLPDPEPDVKEFTLADDLVQESRRLILSYGFSEDFFDKHFTFISASDAITNGAHVKWSFQIGEYETILHDGIGCSACNTSKIKYVHSIAPPLTTEPPIMSDFESVISKSEADSLMASCVGDDFIEERVQLNLNGPTRGLLFTASPKEGAYQCPTDGMAPCINLIGTVDLVTGTVLECNT